MTLSEYSSSYKYLLNEFQRGFINKKLMAEIFNMLKSERKISESSLAKEMCQVITAEVFRSYYRQMANVENIVLTESVKGMSIQSFINLRVAEEEYAVLGPVKTFGEYLKQEKFYDPIANLRGYPGSPCPACGSQETILIAVGQAYDTWECNDCKTQYNPGYEVKSKKSANKKIDLIDRISLDDDPQIDDSLDSRRGFEL